MIRSSWLAVLVFISGCVAQQNSVKLGWQPTSGPVREYQANISDVPQDSKWQQAFNGLLPSRVKLERAASEHRDLGEPDYISIAKQLEQFPLPEDWPFIATISDKGSSILEVRMIGAPAPVAAVEATTEEQRFEQRYRRALEGSLQLLSNMDTQGGVQSFYLTQKQKNLVSMLFSLPPQPVASGDRWPLPINLVELGNGYIVEQARRLSNACLIKLENVSSGDVFAHIVYVVYENLDGYYELKPDPRNPPRPFDLRASYLAYGTFSVLNGHWIRYLGILDFNGSGQFPIQATKLYALRPVSKEEVK